MKISDINKTGFLKSVWMLVLCLGITQVWGQELDKEQQKVLKQADVFAREAQEALREEQFPMAEADYRKAIALNPKSETLKYNLGTAYYNRAQNDEAIQRFKQAASVAQSKAEKHKAYHNLGNGFMNNKKYQEAVEAYKNALRNNPTDEETRYNLALAKEMLEKNPPQGGGGDDNKDQQDQNKDQENKDNQGDNNQGDQGDDKENKDEGDQKDKNKQGDEEDDQGQPKDQNKGEGDKQQQPQQPVPGKLSPQQVKSLLEAMNNEEKKVQDKINAKKQKGAKVKSNKDW
ncbi:tetratricopeptide repeat protein [Luteirhabdus pelagi]|uniref:tetratricopeptide repeat protein n=1 Tax=Luteirhabdus pelagi TaxID=2792783 RepID=UPI00193A84C7|nr:tetratricopeptide repeat protein [Luteirhabdus pelagi]